MQGRKFSSQIRSAISNNTFFSKKIQPYYQTAEGKELYDSFLKVIQFWYPQYLDELRGLADGAGVPYDTVYDAQVNMIYIDSVHIILILICTSERDLY